MKRNSKIWFLILLIGFDKGELTAQSKDVFSKDNLMAWCIVPFDAKHRGPEERARMLQNLGITKLAYDWREANIPEFDTELAALNKYGVSLEAFWLVSGKDAEKNRDVGLVFDFLERNRVQTQIWLMMTPWQGFDELTQTEKVASMAKEIGYIAERAEKLGCRVGLYNHGGWFGEPENQIEIIKTMGMRNVGIVYNFHHARKHSDRFQEFFPKMKPYLFAVNIAGLKEGDDQRFYRTGQGGLEKEMIRTVWKSGYKGPIGVINHDENTDAEKGLQEEIAGLKWILFELKNRRALKSYHE